MLPLFSMNDDQVKDALRLSLHLLRLQSVYLRRQHQWLGALGEVVSTDPNLAERLRMHPSWNLDYESSLHTLQTLEENIDLLISRIPHQ